MKRKIDLVEEEQHESEHEERESSGDESEHDIIDKPVKLDILNEIPPQVNEIPQHSTVNEIKTKGYDVIGVKLFLPKLMKFLPKKGA